MVHAGYNWGYPAKEGELDGIWQMKYEISAQRAVGGEA